MKQTDFIVCELIKSALWNSPVPSGLIQVLSVKDWENIYKEIHVQCIELLFLDLVRCINIPETIKSSWINSCYNRLSYNSKLLYLQKNMCSLLSQESIDYVILKGSAASVFYPKPQYRTMGDIDLIVSLKELEHANEVIGDQYGEPTINYYRNDKNLIREYVYIKDKLAIELHQKFSDLPTADQNNLLNTWIEEGVSSPIIVELNNNRFKMLPESTNGLVLLAHISQHLEGGLGLRQIIDWMMYVDRCLTDDKWIEVSDKIKQLGLQTLAITVTKMCQMYLGLSSEKIHWADSAESDLCEELMEFVLLCGNFGKGQGINNTVSMVISQNQDVSSFLKNLQKRGEYNWRFLEKHPGFRPFAGTYQLFRYINRGLKRKNAIFELQNDIKRGKERDQMLRRLGAMRMKN